MEKTNLPSLKNYNQESSLKHRGVLLNKMKITDIRKHLEKLLNNLNFVFVNLKKEEMDTFGAG